MNFYAVLGIARDAEDETIRSAYRTLARRYHPDRGAGSSAEKFRQVNEAYETLRETGRRHAYDLSLSAQLPVLVRAEPVVQTSGGFPREDPGVFGRRERAPQSFASGPNYVFEVSLGRWIDSLNDLSVWEQP
jgi:DnaJ-class molecular chaperone